MTDRVNKAGTAPKSGSTGFQPVSDGQLIKSKRQLPHWQLGGSTYFITFRSKISYLPAKARQIVLEACGYFNDTRYQLWAAVVMPDHVHLLLTPKEKNEGGYYSLTEILHSLKSFTSNRINRFLNRKGTLWQDDYFNRIVRDEGEFLEKWNYIRNNPVKKELCQHPDEWDAFYEYQGPHVW
jgi:putative transposase